ncbi:RNA-directed DNA polymerase [Sulfurimonas sediminis]|uniref:RNA-directed DNA polymerase n=1 Tax=Sulfurimonas sediminis TaxID=2590020 RepID=A0A7M1B1U7_9BACT|nr:retron St85 family RNA-directed DNA polymerase [Sulfurimonas sediminis]QOP43747.1 RNA-directed DNA polymerase [Sulfurimonas sediminis]
MNTFQKQLSEKFEKPFLEIYQFAYSASRRYKTYNIPKRTGGNRIISQPSKELKEYQRYLITKVFSKFPIHESVYSYQDGKNIKGMALNHVNKRFLLRVDFKSFFPSIKGEYIRGFLVKNIELYELSLSKNDITLINMFVCKSNQLSIGAPSSPIISNILLYELDSYLSEICTNLNIIYTRYADDMYFSTNQTNQLEKILPLLKEYLKSFYIKLVVNEDKNIFTSKKRRQIVTGLILTTDGNISVGKNKKREIKSLIYQYIKQTISSADLNYLKGYLPYLYSIEPSYIDILKRKYTEKIICKLLPLKQDI